ncbi:protein kinase domain-containing protein [Bacillus horti]|uniref:Serine/threonine-protein kinase n=1 Tax=Caldalkalibacillus horti TaxID=77523 RepID=A0ABT9W2Y1_9BACI|nr:protein kinase family protein [Bacillus horti]MDQ0167596.1 serine/threonine-protein kinase [Bacillus horti]
MTTSFSPSIIQGKWHQRKYQIEKELGQGATGTVYLVRHQGSPYALKLGTDSFSITAEVNVLKHFAKAQGGFLGPSIMDVDDWEKGQELQSFYVMNVIQGTSLPPFIKQKGKEWIPVLILQLLTFLSELHQMGWVFGDLKPDNLKVVGKPYKIAWYDAGGMTKLGRLIKEYTEWYDRGVWQMGDRKAEPAYDLFSVGMIMLELYLGKRPEPSEEPNKQLKELVFQNQQIFPYQKVLWEALSGKYATADKMKQALLQAWHVQKGGSFLQPSLEPKLDQASKKRKKKKSKWGKVLFLLFLSSFFLFLYALYLYSQTF